MPKQKNIVCKFCKVTLCVKTWGEHIAGKKHRKNIPPQILIQGIFENDQINEVHAYFESFGKIRRRSAVTVNKEKNIVLFKYSFINKVAHSVIAHKDHVLFGKELKISFSVKPTEQKKVESSSGCNSLASFLTVIIDTLHNSNLPFTEQVATFENLLSDNSKIEARETVRSDLTTTLRNACRNCKIILFGSTESGLNIPNSGLDFYVYNTKVVNKVPNLHSMWSAISQSLNFENVRKNTQNGVEMVVCRHTKTKVLCRVSGSKLMRKSDELVKYYAGLDDKIRQLILVVKCWFYHRHLQLDKSEWFSSYVVYLLVIFFLQQKPYSLPNVLDLDISVRWELEKGWNCTFSPPEFCNKTLKNSTMLELINNFFKFYADFDYFTYAIPPYCGYPIAKVCFIKPYDLPSRYYNYRYQNSRIDLDCGMCIQDPFEHSKNILYKTCVSQSGNFISWCRSSLAFNQTKPGLLSKILNNTSIKGFTVLKPNGYSEEEWRSTIENVTLDILRKIFRYEVSTARSASKLILVCTGGEDLWENRCSVLKRLLPQLPSNASDMEKEIAITERIVAENQSVVKKLNKPGAVFNVTFEENPSRVNFLPERVNKHKRHFDHFIRFKITKFLAETNDRSAVISPDTAQQNIDINPDVPHVEMPATKWEDSVALNIVPKEFIQTEESNTENVTSSGEFMVRNGDEKVQSSNISVMEESKSFKQEVNWSDEEPEEDVPSEFFHDFTRDSFLDGLDLGSDHEESVDSERIQSSSYNDSRSETNETKRLKRNRSSSRDLHHSDSPSSQNSKTRRYSWDNTEIKSEQKDKILAQCEQVLRVMNYQQLKRLQVPQTPRPKSQQYLSPLFRSVTRFSFTSTMKDPTKTPFSDALLKILHSIGILNEPNDVPNLVDSLTEDVASGTVIDKTAIAKILQISLLNCNANQRKKIVNVGIQCEESAISAALGDDNLRENESDYNAY